MNSVGDEQPEYARVLFVIFAIICASSFVIQVVYLQRLRILPVYLLPVLSFCICYENCTLYRSSAIGKHSNTANAGYFFHAVQIPLFVVILFEVCHRLHEVKAAHFWCIPFDQGSNVTKIPSVVAIWVFRIIALGLLIMNLFSAYGYGDNLNDPQAGVGGYASLAGKLHSTHMWISLIPSIALAVLGLFMGTAMYRFGKHFSSNLIDDSNSWTILLVTVILQIIGQCFVSKVYPTTSNAGNICLVLGLSWTVHKVQEDLLIAGAFADFLHVSNVVFSKTLTQKDNAAAGLGHGHGRPPRPTHPHSHPHPHHSQHASTRLRGNSGDQDDGATLESGLSNGGGEPDIVAGGVVYKAIELRSYPNQPRASHSSLDTVVILSAEEATEVTPNSLKSQSVRGAASITLDSVRLKDEVVSVGPQYDVVLSPGDDIGPEAQL